MFSKYIVPALAAASGAYAQCSASGTTTVSDAAGATAIAGCTTYSGSIAMATSSSGQMTFDGIRAITGDFIGYNTPNVTGVSAATLQSIGGTLGLSDMTVVSSLNFPELTTVNTLSMTTIGPNLQTLTFTAGITTIGTLTFVDTYVQALTGISPTSVQAMNIAQNTYLTSIDLPLRVVTGLLSVSANANGNTNLSLASLETAGSMIISNVTNLSLPRLNNVTMLFSLTGNKFTNMALPNFTTSAGFAIENNDAMTNFTVPVYAESTQGLSVQNNTALTGTISFPALTRVVGAVVVKGDFSSLLMPNLNSAQGAVTILSTEAIPSTCSYFDNLRANSVIQGVETCSPSASAASTATTASGSASGTSTGSASTGTTTKSAGMSFAPSEASAYTVFGMLAAFFGLLM